VVNDIKKLINTYCQPQQILFVPSTCATYFSHTVHSQALNT